LIRFNPTENMLLHPNSFAVSVKPEVQGHFLNSLIRPRFSPGAVFGVSARITLLMTVAVVARAQEAATNQPVPVSNSVVTNLAPSTRTGQAGGGFGAGNNAVTERDHQNMMEHQNCFRAPGIQVSLKHESLPA
jgi:hypothetical protein